MISSIKPASVRLQETTPTIVVPVTYVSTGQPANAITFGGTPTNNVLLAGAGTTKIQLSLSSLDGSAVFTSPTPLSWIVAPPGPLIVPTFDSPQLISFTVPQPPSFFKPWSFRVNVNGLVTGITSSTFFLVKPTASGNEVNVTLIYDVNAGSFNLDEGLDLRQEFFLVNTASSALTVSITAIDPQQNPVTFASPAIAWTSGQPSWVTPNPVSANGNQLAFQISNQAPGQSAGFKLIVLAGGVTPVASPDPILINATLGDGPSVLFPALGS